MPKKSKKPVPPITSIPVREGELLEKLSMVKREAEKQKERIAQLEDDRNRLEKELKRLREENDILRSNAENSHHHLIAVGTRLKLMHKAYDNALKLHDDVIKNILERGRIRAKHDELYRHCRAYIIAGYTKYDEIAIEVALKAPQYSIHKILEMVEEMEGKEFTDEQQATIISKYEKRRPKTWSSFVKEGQDGTYDILVKTSLNEVHALEDEKVLMEMKGKRDGQ